MVTRTELTKRVIVLEEQIVSQTDLTENVKALEAKTTEMDQTLQNLSNTVNVFGASLSTIQKELANLTATKVSQKKTKRK